MSGTWGYRRELRGPAAPRLRWQLPASLVGGVTGAWLLLHLPETTFKAVVPVLLVVALILVVIQPRLQVSLRRRAEAAGRDHVTSSATGRMVALVVGTFLVGIYGGYFAAAQGILLIGVMGALLHRDDAADQRREEPADAGGEHRRGDRVHAGRVRPDQLGGGRADRGGVADRRLHRRRRRPPAARPWRCGPASWCSASSRSGGCSA